MNIKKSELYRLLYDFSKACDININIYDNNLKCYSEKNPINKSYCEEIQKTKEGKELCRLSDLSLIEECKKTKSPQIHICHGGLVDIVVPIIFENEIFGYTILGQIRTKNNFDCACQNVKHIVSDKKLLKKYYNKLPFFTKDRLQSIISVATVFSRYIFMENLYNIKDNTLTQRVISYMNNNIKNNISVQEITKNIGICKSTLYKNFKDNYNCTPKEYLNKMRITKSLKILVSTDYSIEKISETVGFSDASYYSKLFKKEIGVSPLKYRKQKKEN